MTDSPNVLYVDDLCALTMAFHNRLREAGAIGRDVLTASATLAVSAIAEITMDDMTRIHNEVHKAYCIKENS